MNKGLLCLRSLLALAAIALSTGAVASAQYKFVRLNVPGATETIATGISNSNLIVGYYSTTTATAGFTYNPTTKQYQYPIGISWAYLSETYAANKAGTIVGAYATSPTSGYFGMVGQGGSFSEFQEGACSGTKVTGINDYPTTVGSCYVDVQGQQITEAWVGDPWDTTYTCPNATSTTPAAINNWGISGGTIYYGTGQNISVYGYISTTDGSCTTISYPGSAYTTVGGLNDTGTISGTFWAGAAGSSHGFVLVGSQYSKVDVPKTKATSIGQVNNNKWIVGSFVDAKNRVHGFYGVPLNGASTLDESQTEEKK